MEDPTTNPPSPIHTDKNPDKYSANKAAQCSVISLYRTMIAGNPHTVKVTWSKSLINHSLSVSIDNPSPAPAVPFACRVDLKPWPFWGKKGFKSSEVDGRRVDVFWDLRSAKFCTGPEPSAGYYVAFVCDDEVILLLGDCKKEAYKRTKSRPSLDDARLMSKRENVFGKRCFSTRARFDERSKREHDIVVENSISGTKDPEMWISVDGVVMIHVDNLQWKFRGNETVMVEESPVQVLWDVHEWLFGGAGAGSGHGLFIFKPGAAETAVEGGGGEEERGGLGVNVGDGSWGRGCCSVQEFCFYLYAWKVE